MKTYVITVSRNFPTTHAKKGLPTFFVEKIHQGIKRNLIPCELCHHNPTCNKTHCIIDSMRLWNKIHTIRANYPLWRKRFDEIEAGNACLSLRYWSGKPYRSKQVEIVRLTKEDGIGLQEIVFRYNNIDYPAVLHRFIRTFTPVALDDLAKNDGLSFDDFKEWFKDYDLSDPMTIIHFTNFRY